MADLPFHSQMICPVCALPSPQGKTCGNCLKLKPHFDETVAAFSYDFPFDALIRSLKYDGNIAIAELIGQQMANLVTEMRPELMIPMPLHPSRLAERGFNQAVEMTRTLSKRLGIPVSTDIALRIKPTQPQAGLPLKQRIKNLHGAFACVEDLGGKNIAIVDDVMTTGTSLNALAKTLKEAGAGRVACWVAARTLRD